MPTQKRKQRIAILGAGPSGLFAYGRLVELNRKDIEIHLFERKPQLGPGMPYSHEGANKEHVTNVSDKEIPHIATTLEEWIHTVPLKTLNDYGVELKSFNEHKVIPRLLFGQYLSAQFDLLQKEAKNKGLSTTLHLSCHITDLVDCPEKKTVKVETEEGESFEFDYVIICTGHNWPKKQEGITPGYYDSPYPPSKLTLQVNHPIAIKGSSLTAIDAIRTLARHNGTFVKDTHGRLSYQSSTNSPAFKLVLHSIKGLLPAVRFHLEEPHVSTKDLLTPKMVAQNMKKNGGFLSLDFLFEKNFKEKFKTSDPEYYARIKEMSLEEFVESAMELREEADPFELLKAEYKEAEKSIKRKESIHWKEMLATLSLSLNQPAKYLSAEDMMRLKKVLMPLISIVIAFVPQNSCNELFALHEAGKLEVVAVDSDSKVIPNKEGGATYTYKDETGASQSVPYKTFIDCVGQPHLSYEDFPFKSLISEKKVSPARLKFKSAENGQLAWKKDRKSVEKGPNGHYYLKVPGVTINDFFQLVNPNGVAHSRLYIMAVPYIGGYNPDYSGLDFCEATSDIIVKNIFSRKKNVKSEPEKINNPSV